MIQIKSDKRNTYIRVHNQLPFWEHGMEEVSLHLWRGGLLGWLHIP